MAKLGKLTKLKSAAIKRWPSLTKLSRTGSCVSAAISDGDDNHEASDHHDQNNLHAVYVGKSRRRYLVRSDVVDHPVFQELVERSAAAETTAEVVVVVACEVVLFEHLLWMIESSETSQMGSMDELVEFYTCASPEDSSIPN